MATIYDTFPDAIDEVDIIIAGGMLVLLFFFIGSSEETLPNHATSNLHESNH